ncbi:hypothetical protein Tco_0689165 [Tanacetum coccineum]
MRTRSQTRNRNRQQQAQPAVVQPFHLEEPFVNPPLVPMADNRTMAQLLQAPTEGYEDAIVIPEINANFELKHGLINLVQNKQFFGHDKEDPHAHIRYFNKITSTMRFPDIPSTSIKLMLFPFSLEELHQLDTFYNALNANDQDSLNSAAGGNFLDKMPRECLRIIESKSKVRNSRNKAVVAKVSSNSSTPGISPDVAALTTEVSELKNLMKTMLIDKQKAQAPATVKAVEQSCVTCGGAHSYKNCPATDGNIRTTLRVVSKAAAATFNQAIHILTSDGCQSKSVPPVEITSTMDQVYQTRTSHHKFTKAQPYQAPAQQVQGVSKTDFEKLCQVLPLEVALLTKDPRFLITSTLSNECETEVKWTRCLLLIMEWHEAIQPQSPVVHHESISEPVNAPVSASMPNQKTSIPFPSRRNDERRREKANDQIEKFY